MAWPGCPRSQCCCLGQLPLQDQCLPHCRDLSLCPETSVHPAGLPIPPENHGTSISGSPGCQGFVGMGGSRALPPSPRPGALPAPLAGCSLWLCPELSAWSSPTELPRAPAAWVLQSLNPCSGLSQDRDLGRCYLHLAAPAFCHYFGYCLSPPLLGISAVTPCEPAAT